MRHPQKAGLALCVGLTAGFALMTLAGEASARDDATSNRPRSADDDTIDPWDEEDTSDAGADENADDTAAPRDLTPDQEETTEEGVLPQEEQPEQAPREWQSSPPREWQSPREWQQPQQGQSPRQWQSSQQGWQEQVTPGEQAPPSTQQPWEQGAPQGGRMVPYILGPLTGQPGPVWSPYITGAAITGGWAPHLLRGFGAGIHSRFPQGTSGGAAPHHHPSGSAGPGQTSHAGNPMPDISGAGPMYGAPGGVAPSAPRGSFGAGLPREGTSAQPGLPPSQRGATKPGSVQQPSAGPQPETVHPSLTNVPSNQPERDRLAPIQARNQASETCPCPAGQGMSAPSEGHGISFGAGLGPTHTEGAAKPRAGVGALGDIDLGPVLGHRAQPWTPSLGIGPGVHGHLNGKR
ncbi:Hypothetical protein A7982_10155 [Minicystis rosea]|nr:Hypothetical protein A7982_10155 [Minicystis rosea]